MKINKRTLAILAGIIVLVLIIGAWYFTAMQPPEKKLTIYFFDPEPGNPWWDLVPHGIQMAIDDLQKTTGVKVEYKRFDATSLDQQVSQLQSALSIKPDIAIVGARSDAVQDILKQLRNAGVKVILVDRDVPDKTARDLYLGTDNRYAGFFVAQAFLKYLQSEGVNPPYKVIIFRGLPGVPTVSLRYQGMMDALQPLIQEGKAQVVSVVEVDSGNYQECYSKAQTLVATYGKDVNLWLATNNLQAMAIVKALQDAGYTPGKGKYVLGFDAQPSDWLQMIQNGLVSISVTQTPHLMGYWAVWAGYYLSTGQVSLPSGAVINTPLYTVLPNNATVVATKIDYLTVSPNELLNLMKQLTPSHPQIQAPPYKP